MRCLLATAAVILCIAKYVNSLPLDTLSCDGNCDAPYDSSLQCQCNDQCRQYDNCCEDFVSVCASLDMRRPHWKKPRKMRKKLRAEPAGNTVQFKCLADGAKPITIEWYRERTWTGTRNGTLEKVSKDKRVGGFKFKHSHQTIMMKAVEPSDSAFYTCVVSNKYGSINHTYELDVAERSSAPPIVQDIMNQTVELGSDVTFKCYVYSDAYPHIQWLRINPKHDDSSGALDYEVLKNSGIKNSGINTTEADLQTLKLLNVGYKDAGEYSCLAGNSIGYSYKSAWLKVIPKQKALPAAQEVNIELGQSFQLDCSDLVEGPTQTPFEQWYDPKGSSLVWLVSDIINKGNAWVDDKMSVDGAAHTFTLNNAQFSDAGRYKCVRKGAEDYIKVFQVNIRELSQVKTHLK